MSAVGRPAGTAAADGLTGRFAAVRARSLALTAGLSDADATVQSMPDASPAKWHLAHTSWFFETFVLVPHAPGYTAFDPAFAYLFNSYYETAGARHARPLRGMLTRPSLDRVRAYRAHVDAAVMAAGARLPAEALALLELGLAHEEQHQELILIDLLHLFSLSPLSPAAFPPVRFCETGPADPLGWTERPGGLAEIGHAGAGFAFDSEGPRHKVWLEPYALSNRLVTNGEWLAFIEDGGYRQPLLWLSAGWERVCAEAIAAPLYWRAHADGWRRFTLGGEVALDPACPVTHVSFYEADAFARWSGARLPTEAEWEAAAAGLDPAEGNLLEGPGAIGPLPARGAGLRQMFGDCWEWTASAFAPYPGFRAAKGAIGEYNGKFMSGQMVLRGGSAATPRGHMRPSYRNFFPPEARWQMSGVRLARDV